MPFLGGDHHRMDSSGLTFTVEGHELECGRVLKGARVRYRQFGQLNAARDNAMVVCHALTGNAAVDSWWKELFGPGQLLDPAKYFIVCANMLGSCYGTTGPTELDPETDKPYGTDFPDVTVRDSVRLHIRLVREGLGVQSIACVIGGSLGGMQCLEWAAICGPEYIRSIIPICCGASHQPWQIGISEVQRQAIYADADWKEGQYTREKPPHRGLAVARQIAMISYRSHTAYSQKFARKVVEGGRQAGQGQRVFFQVEDYLRKQGQKFLSRFDALSYIKLTRTMDSHDLGRGRAGGIQGVLRRMTMPALVISVTSDTLYPPSEQKALFEGLPNSEFLMIDRSCPPRI